MARHKNRDRIRAACAADGANGFRFANRLRDFAVAFRPASGNFPHRVPDFPLKFRSAAQIERRQIFRRTPGQRTFQRSRGCPMPAENFGRNRGAEASGSLAEQQLGPTDSDRKIQFGQSFGGIACDELAVARGEWTVGRIDFSWACSVSGCADRPGWCRAAAETENRRKQ